MYALVSIFCATVFSSRADRESRAVCRAGSYDLTKQGEQGNTKVLQVTGTYIIRRSLNWKLSSSQILPPLTEVKGRPEAENSIKGR